MQFNTPDGGLWAFAAGLLALVASSASVWIAASPFA
jgi:hypothetical protein